MKADIKKRWVAALRSGVYPQTQEKLRDDKGFCCLGVLCDVVKKDLGEDWGDPVNDSGAYSFISYQVELPARVINLCGFKGCEIQHGSPYANGKSLVLMNDRDRNTFDEIADTIEKHL